MPKTPSSDRVPRPWNLVVHRPREDTLVLVLGGHWRLHDDLPAGAALNAELALPTRYLILDAAGINAWDSGLLTYLVSVIKLCRGRGVAVDTSSLPQGVRRLLRLAFAVPGQSVIQPSPEPSGVLARIGATTLYLARDLHAMLDFLGQLVITVLRLLRGRARYRTRDLALILQEVGPQALPIVSLISFLVGVILAYMGALQLALFGAQIYIADLVGIGMVREIGALMTGIIVAGRTGAAFAAQIGTMQVNEELDALRTLGIQPLEFLVLPRILALVLMVPLLTLYASFVGILAGMLVAATVFDVGPFEYYHQTLRALDVRHLAVGVSKGTTYGALVAFAGCLRGIHCGRSAEAVGKATTSAVVTAILLIVIAASTLTIIYQKLGI